MIAIFRKEVNLFLSSLVGYIAITIFLIANGLICWVFTDSNIFDGGYASLDSFFQFAPWIFLFLIPAITMRSFAEETETGTMELLATKPVTDLQIIWGKFLAALFLVLFSILPTIVYYFAISELASPVGNVDTGGIIGSYIGLFFLGATFVAIGLFTSSVTNNQIISFITGLFACFIMYQAFDSIAQIPAFVGSLDKYLIPLSLNEHYASISKGVIDTRDVLYFCSVIAFFFVCTKTVLGARKW
jgi:ABC-2 type transport system permease protein